MAPSRKEYTRQWRANNKKRVAEQRQRARERSGIKRSNNKKSGLFVVKDKDKDRHPLFDPTRDSWPDHQDITARFCNDPPIGYRELTSRAAV